MSCAPLSLETIWFDKHKFEDAERVFHERKHKLQWIKSSSKMSETKVEPNEEQKEVQPIKDAVKEEPLLLAMDKSEKIEAVASPQEEVKKPVKEKKKEDKAAKNNEKKDEAVEKEEKSGDKQAKKKNKEEQKDDAKDKQAKKKKVEKSASDTKKSKDEKIEGKKDDVASESTPTSKSENQIDVEMKEGSPSKDDGKKGSKKNKKTKNKKNQQAAEGKQETTDGKSNENVKEPTNKKTEKKESPTDQQKKKGEKKEPKKVNPNCTSAGKISLADEIARTRQHIKNSLNFDAGAASGDNANILSRIKKLEDENKRLRSVADDVRNMTLSMTKLLSRVDELEKNIKSSGCCEVSSPQKADDKSKKVIEDDVDIFASDEDDEEKEKIKAERLRLYEEKKSKKPALVAKSNIILDVKPWDDETDMKAMETRVRAVACDGLLWGASKLVPLAFGIHKLQISCVIEDEKVSVDWLQEQIEANEDLVQSVDIAAFNKV